MKTYLRLIAATALTASAALASPVSAARFFDFSYTGAGIAASGRLTTNDGSSRGDLTITGITGQRNGLAINRLFPAGTAVDEFGSFTDNSLSPIAPFLSFHGFGFGTVGSDVLYNPYFIGGNYQEFSSLNGVGLVAGGGPVIQFNLAEVSSAVPEPGTWAMMLVGFGAVGYALRRRPRTTVRVRFA